MKSRKSSNIGKIIGGFKVLDNIPSGSDTIYIVECVKCKNIMQKGRRSIIYETTKCNFCDRPVRVPTTPHELRGTKIYTTFTSMLQRVYDKNKDNYKWYGGRGIKVCNEWYNDFMAFYRWSMENGYKEGLTIDRIDTDGDYCPDNCRWVTRAEQASNRRSNIIVEYNGETMTLMQLIKKYNLKQSVVYQRHDNGWAIDDIVNKSVRSMKERKPR